MLKRYKVYYRFGGYLHVAYVEATTEVEAKRKVHEQHLRSVVVNVVDLIKEMKNKKK